MQGAFLQLAWPSLDSFHTLVPLQTSASKTGFLVPLPVCCNAWDVPLGGSVSEHSLALRRGLGQGWAGGLSFSAKTGLWEQAEQRETRAVPGKLSIRYYGNEGQRSAYCLCALRACCSHKADICHHSNKGISNPKAVWEVSLERMAITLCPPRFDFLTDHWVPIHP